MMKTVKALEALGVPDRYGLIGGIRERIATLLVDIARKRGAEAFRDAAAALVDAVIEDASDA